MIVLLLVGYSCITSMYIAAFQSPKSKFMRVLNWIVEAFFYTDLVLSFFHAYYDTERNIVVKDLKSI